MIESDHAHTDDAEGQEEPAEARQCEALTLPCAYKSRSTSLNSH
jgi:hypothetical protein